MRNRRIISIDIVTVRDIARHRLVFASYGVVMDRSEIASGATLTDSAKDPLRLHRVYAIVPASSNPSCGPLAQSASPGDFVRARTLHLSQPLPAFGQRASPNPWEAPSSLLALARFLSDSLARCRMLSWERAWRPPPSVRDLAHHLGRPFTAPSFFRSKFTSPAHKYLTVQPYKLGSPNTALKLAPNAPSTTLLPTFPSRERT